MLKKKKKEEGANAPDLKKEEQTIKKKRLSGLLKGSSKRGPSPSEWKIEIQSDTFKKLSTTKDGSSAESMKKDSPKTDVPEPNQLADIPKATPRERAESVGGPMHHAAPPSVTPPSSVRNSIRLFESSEMLTGGTVNPTTPGRSPSPVPTSPKDEATAQPPCYPETVEGLKQTVAAKDKEIKKLKKELASIKALMKMALPAGPAAAGADATNIKIVKSEQKDELLEYQKKYQAEVAKRVKLEEQVEKYQNMEHKVKLLQEGMKRETDHANTVDRDLKKMTLMYEREIQRRTTAEVNYHKLVRQTAVLLNFVEHLKHETQLLYRMVTIEMKDKKGGEKLQSQFRDIEKYIMVSNVEFRRNFFGGAEEENQFYQQAKILLGGIEKEHQRIDNAEKKIEAEAEEVREAEEQWEMVDIGSGVGSQCLGEKEEKADSTIEDEDSQLTVTHPLLQSINDKYQQKLGTIIVQNSRVGAGIGDIANFMYENSEQNNKLYTLVVNELVETERTFVRDMVLLVNEFRQPLVTKRIISPFEAQDIFSTVDDIIVLNKELLEGLEKEAVKDIVDQRIGKVVLQLFTADRYKPYATYCANQNMARTVINGLKNNNTAFINHLASVRGQSPKRLEIQCYLIKPMQRICKYPLLIKELLKFSTDKHPDHQNLVAALAKTEMLLTNINDLLMQSTRVVQQLAMTY